jgi:hypothetical protein
VTRGAREHDGERLPDTGSIEMGTVGWDDGGKHYELDPDSGVTLIKVTLFRGRDPDAEGQKKDKRARGQQIKCQISGPLLYIPADGTMVHVSMPAGYWQVPGAGMITAVAVKAPAVQFGTNDGKDAVLDFGPDRRVIIKAGKGVILSDYENRYLAVSPQTGIKCGDAHANGFALKNDKWLFYTTADGEMNTCFQLAKSAIKLLINDGKTCGVVMKDGKWQGCGDKFEANFAGGSFGKFAGPETPATHGIAYSAAGPANATATSWIVSSA